MWNIHVALIRVEYVKHLLGVYPSLLSEASLNPGLNTSEYVVSVCAPFHAWVNSGSNFWPSKLEYLSVGQDFESIFELNLN